MKRSKAEEPTSERRGKAGLAGGAGADPTELVDATDLAEIEGPTELAESAELAELAALARNEIVAIIPAWNARGRLPAILAALAGQVALAIVVDNGSTDGSAAALRSAGARLPGPTFWSGSVTVDSPKGRDSTSPDSWRLRLPVLLLANSENRGYPSAVNQGLAWGLAAGARGLLLVNDDALFESGAVAALDLALAEDPRTAAATAKMLYADRRSILNGTGGRYLPDRAWAALRGEGEADRGQYDNLPWVDYPSGAASLLRPAALEALGLLDELYYLYYEDVDWGLRARAAGWRTRYVPQARVQHLGSASTARDPARRRYYNVRNRLRFARIHARPAGRLRAWLETLHSLALQPLRWLWPSRRRDAEAAMLATIDHLRGRYGRSARFG